MPADAHSPARPRRDAVPREPLPGRLAAWASVIAAGALGAAVAVWGRVLPPLLGRDAETARLLAAIVVTGLATGGLLRWLTVDRPAGPAALAVSATAVSLGLAVPWALGDRLAVFALLLRPLAEAGGSLRLLGHGLVVAALGLPAAVAWGHLLVGLAARRARPAAAAAAVAVTAVAGAAVAITAMAVGLGALAAGPELVSRLSVPGLWRATVAVTAGLGVLLALASRRPAVRRRRDRARLATAGALLLVTVALASTPGPGLVSRHAPIGAGQLRSGLNGLNDLARQLARQRRQIAWAVDGRRHGLALAVDDGYTLRVDGAPSGGLRDAPGAAMSALIGAALHPHPRTALVLGLGDGVAAGWLAATASIERVDVAEREPAMERVARACESLNRGALSRPEIRILRRSGLDVLLPEGEPYDLILAGDARGGDRRLWMAAASRLGDGGLLLQRLRDASPARARALAQRLGEVLPAVERWQVQADGWLLVASRRPVARDGGRLRELAGQPPLSEALDRLWGVDGLAGLLTGRDADPGGLEVDAEAVADQRAARDLAWGRLPPSTIPTSGRAFLAGDLRQALLLRPRKPPASPMERLLLAEASAEFADDRVPALARELRGRRPVEADAVLARWHARRRAPGEATRHLVAAFEGARRDPWVFAPTLERALALAVELSPEGASGRQLSDALAEPFAARLLDEPRWRTRVALAVALDDPRACTEALAASEPDPPWEEAFLQDRWRCYQRAHHPLAEPARRDLETFRAAEPPSLEAGLLGAAP